jgi:hypothetical protein
MCGQCGRLVILACAAVVFDCSSETEQRQPTSLAAEKLPVLTVQQQLFDTRTAAPDAAQPASKNDAAVPEKTSVIEQAMRSQLGPLAKLALLEFGMQRRDVVRLIGQVSSEIIVTTGQDLPFAILLESSCAKTAQNAFGVWIGEAAKDIKLPTKHSVVNLRFAANRLIGIKVATIEDVAPTGADPWAPLSLTSANGWWKGRFEIQLVSYPCVIDRTTDRVGSPDGSEQTVHFTVIEIAAPIYIPNSCADIMKMGPKLIGTLLSSTNKSSLHLRIEDETTNEAEQVPRQQAAASSQDDVCNLIATTDDAGVIRRVSIEAGIRGDEDERERLYDILKKSWGEPTPTVSPNGRFALRFRVSNGVATAVDISEKWHILIKKN